MQVESGFTKYSGRVPPLDLSNVNVCARDSDLRWNKMPTSISASTTSSSGASISKKPAQEIQMGSDGLPIDPRDWTRADVWKWLINLAISEGLDATPDLAQKFPMNGKALCLMTLDMYLSRVPVGGKMLYRDFRVRLARAMSL
ncbi:unnamed protein product [Hermetia illucens]|uniref:PNT domain-containing protein n=1 Tax=Hermetia illucens TaxID=343691 RepID=A0A7R8UCC0_HERIL|nr:uncharacterized protein LOC119646505 [Hermetia illucens]CAD7078098.1 unnamed protein product [Hermetia illucens]